MKDILFNLCKLSGISGYESSTAAFCADYLKKFTDNVKVDFNNNVIAAFGSDKSKDTLLLDAHIDRIGFIVTDITDDGFVKADKVGGIDLRTVPDALVTVHGKEDINGIVCCMPPHLSDGNEDKAVEIDKLYIDLGLPCDKVKQLVCIGDSVSYYSEPKELMNNRIKGPALDNLSGVAVMLKVAENICNCDLKYNVAILLSCQEETFAVGAKTKAFELEPDECICVDVSFAAQPGINNQYANIKLGKGPMLCISPNMDRGMFNKLKNICIANGIDYQTEVCNGKTGTNADHITVSRSGVKSALISITERNMHTQSEIIDLRDVQSAVKLITEYIKGGNYE